MTFQSPPEPPDDAQKPFEFRFGCETCDALIRNGDRFDLQCRYDMGPLQELRFCPREVQGPGVTSQPVFREPLRGRPWADPGGEKVGALAERSRKFEHDLKSNVRKKRKKRRVVDARQKGLFG